MAEDSIVNPNDSRQPLVSLLMPTRDRPTFLAHALACQQRQTYPNIELLVLDHGDRHRVDRRMVSEAGGRLIRIDPAVTLGEALNAGVAAATGEVCIKVDDDDWYAAGFVARWIDAARAQLGVMPSSFVLVPTGYLVFDLAAWEIRSAPPLQFAGAALAFLRSDAVAQPFRAYDRHEDTNFYNDLIHARGAVPIGLERPEEFIAVRHGAAAIDRGHTWLTTHDERAVEDELRDRPADERRPEDLISAWALPFYRELHSAAKRAELRE